MQQLQLQKKEIIHMLLFWEKIIEYLKPQILHCIL